MVEEKTKLIVIKKSHPDFFDIRWAVLARKLEYPLSFGCLEIKENEFACTDGNRLHVVRQSIKHPDLSIGTYRVVKANKTIIKLELYDDKDDKDDKFPDYNKIIPTYNNSIEVLSNSFNRFVFTMYKTDIDKCLNTNFIADFFECIPRNVKVSWVPNIHKPVSFEYKNYQAIIIPIKM